MGRPRQGGRIDKPPTANSVRVNKQQVASTELSRALRLFFHEHDLICAHVLASAAREVIQPILKQAGKQGLRDRLKPEIIPGMEEAAHEWLSGDYNFFKHGMRDAGATLNFDPERCLSTLLETCMDFEDAFGSHYETTLFMCWFTSHYVPAARSPAFLANMKMRKPDDFDEAGKLKAEVIAADLRAVDAASSYEGLPPLYRILRKD